MIYLWDGVYSYYFQAAAEVKMPTEGCPELQNVMLLQ
jgi:hypothetical protein